jgi:hypothetical protein
MDESQKLDIIENAKLILDMQLEYQKDGLLNLFLTRAIDYTLNYCKIDEIPPSFHSLIEEMIVFQYRQKGVENVQSEGKGSLSQSFISEYPPNIMNRLQPYSRVKFL